jgi:hypothetical protein
VQISAGIAPGAQIPARYGGVEATAARRTSPQEFAALLTRRAAVREDVRRDLEASHHERRPDSAAEQPIADGSGGASLHSPQVARIKMENLACLGVPLPKQMRLTILEL